MIINKKFDYGNPFDFGRVSQDYAKFRDIYPDEFYKKVLELGICTDGQQVLDLGTGTGVLLRNMYRHGATFIGADISENQTEQARLLSKESGMDIEYIVASAETFDFPPNTFDAVTAVQCFQYFNSKSALPKIHAVLKDGGHFCVMFMAWLPEEDEIAKRTEELVLKYNPAWTGGGMTRKNSWGSGIDANTDVTPKWAVPLFETAANIGFDVNVKFTRESWHGRIKACRGIGASNLSAEEIAAFEEEHIAYIRTVPEEFDVLHYATILKLRKV